MLRPSRVVIPLVLVVAFVTSCTEPKKKRKSDDDDDRARPKSSAPSAVVTSAKPGPVDPAPNVGGQTSLCAPACVDATHARICSPDGKPSTVDCTAEDKRCLRNVCSPRVCKPKSVHCFEGNVYQCDETGASRVLTTPCRPESVCMEDAATHVGACVKSCDKSMSNVALAVYDCEACNWNDADFCAQEGPERGCSEVLCQEGELGFGVSNFTCTRETDGLVVPSTDQRKPCDDKTHTAIVEYEICMSGRHEKRYRVEGCTP